MKNIHDKLLFQAEEAKDLGLLKLASVINNSIPENFPEQYSYSELKEDIHEELWKIATKLITYYNLNNVDALNLDKTLVLHANNILNDLESVLEVDIISPYEPKVPGENK